MTKNISVVDEQGNQYEATYPKRAKGLVKNGRARFIDENTICLACPPNTELEDKIMSENIDKPLTAREIFEKIAELQKQLTESSFHSLHRLGDSISSICTDENEEKSEQISEVCSVFKMRETTLLKMLALYEKMYDDLRPEKVDSDRVAILDTLIGTLGEGLTPMQTKEALVEILTTSL